MKTRSFFFVAAAFAAALLPASVLHSQVARNGGETTIALDIAFGIRYVPPSRVTVPPTEHLIIRAPDALANVTGYAWFKDGQPLPGATGPELIIDVAQPSDAGSYKYNTTSTEARNINGSSQTLNLNVRPVASMINLSTRGFAGSGDQTMISGFVVDGKNAPYSTLLIRAVGPSLERFGVSGVLKEPKISIFTADGKPYTREFWYPLETGFTTREQHIQAITAQVGAFPLNPNSKDAVELRPFPPGVYTVHVSGLNGTSGNVIFEIYQAQE